MPSTIDVSAGIIVKNFKILAARRKKGLHLAGFWEFPGGKVETGETPKDCLIRELNEEFGIETRIGDFVAENLHAYGEKVVRLIAYRVEHLSGDFQLTDHDQIKWLSLHELDAVEWAEADIPLVQACKSIMSINNYYQKHAYSYAQDTLEFNLSDLYERFLACIPDASNILDLGCGSGRDSRYFLDHGYSVTALDGSSELATLAEKLIGQPVIVSLFQDMHFENEFDGVWACASLLHCPKSQIENVLIKVQRSLKMHGVFYASFKWGEHETCDELGRFFNNYSLEQLVSLINSIKGFEILANWEELKPLRNSSQKWVNIISRKVEG